MAREQSPIQTPAFESSHSKSAFWVSVQSVVWTVAASSVAVVLGVYENSAVLIAFGAIGLVDTIGSVTLAYHFRHSLRHERHSERLERLAHRVVLIGLAAVGLAAVGGGLVRLALNASGEGSAVAMVFAAASLLVLTVLAARKRSIARSVSSQALLADAHLSAIGAAQASVALVGSALALLVGWSWVDAVATMIIGAVAVRLAVRSR